MKTLALIALSGVASTATAQDLVICLEEVSVGNWEMTAEFVTTPPAAIDQVWADAQFDILGDGSDITIGSYNPSYDTSLGNAIIVNGPTASFTGNANAFFGTPDSSNPLFVLDFTYSGDFNALGLDFTGQNSALFDDGSAFGLVVLYTDALGNPSGDLTTRVDVKPIPAPASAALLGLGGLAAARRRR